ATSIRRDVSPRPASRELAIREVGEGITISSFGGGGGTCTVPPEKVVDERGVADVLPAIRDIAVAPDGTAWVRHFAVKGEPAPIDVFSPDGAYRGTLPVGSPFPVAFFPDGRIIAIEKDELDVPRVVVYHVETCCPVRRRQPFPRDRQPNDGTSVPNHPNRGPDLEETR